MRQGNRAFCRRSGGACRPRYSVTRVVHVLCMNSVRKQPKPDKTGDRNSLILLVFVVWLAKRKRAKSLAQGDWLFFCSTCHQPALQEFSAIGGFSILLDR